MGKKKKGSLENDGTAEDREDDPGRLEGVEIDQDDSLDEDGEDIWWGGPSNRTAREWIKEEVEKAQWDSEENP